MNFFPEVILKWKFTNQKIVKQTVSWKTEEWKKPRVSYFTRVLFMNIEHFLDPRQQPIIYMLRRPSIGI